MFVYYAKEGRKMSNKKTPEEQKAYEENLKLQKEVKLAIKHFINPARRGIGMTDIAHKNGVAHQ